jgi:hypothetical protein
VISSRAILGGLHHDYARGSKYSYVVEIDRGTMPVVRSNFKQTSFEMKMRAYLTAHAAKQHEQRLRWNSFRVARDNLCVPRNLI